MPLIWPGLDSLGAAYIIIHLMLCAAHAATIDVGPQAEFNRIQDAIDAASPGDTINVANATYYENVNITKSLILKGRDHPVVDASGRRSAIVLSADKISLEGFRAVNSQDSGIKVISCCNILRDNIASDNSIGIDMVNSSHNMLRDNSFFDNKASFQAMFFKDVDSYNDIDTSNLAEGKPIYYIMNASDKVIDSTTNAALVYCLNCNNITVRGLHLERNTMSVLFYKTADSLIEDNLIEECKGGIFLQNSKNNTIRNNSISHIDRAGIFVSSSRDNILEENSISGNYYGIFLLSSINNHVRRNILINNYEGIRIFQNSYGNEIMRNILDENRCGIYVQGSGGNEIYLNDFRNNKRSVSSLASSNAWNSTSTIIYNYSGNISADYLGNFWSDRSTENGQNIGIWDKPYSVGSDWDWHPLTYPFENYGNDHGNMSG